MTNRKKDRRGADVFIVDNSDADWKVLQYLNEWSDFADAFDIATGNFEIGSLLALDGTWQKLEKIRILMGDEVTPRTKRALLQALKEQVAEVLDQSLEAAKESNDFLVGVPAILDAVGKRQIECRVYTKDKFHAKAYITHGKRAVLGSQALVGSSNFTLPGLTDNVELNIQVRREVESLQEWYERHWKDAEDVSEDVLRIIERHVREYMPFDVYAKALDEFFRGHQATANEWEGTESRVYPKLDKYQQDGYHAMLKIADKHGGAFLCDGVGLGKTFVGMMLIERLVEYDRKRVALFVPKGANEPVWKATLDKYLPGLGGDFSNLVILNHTDLQRAGEYPERIRRVKEKADVIVIDEAHHFRNPGVKGLGHRKPSRYWKMYDICEGKQVFMLTATPVNNRLIDLQHMIELFSRRAPDHFKGAPLGIHSLPGHFRKLEKELESYLETRDGPAAETNQSEAQEVLAADPLVREIVVQRSRAYVKESQSQHGGRKAVFPDREAPKVAEYSLKKTYGKLLKMIEDAFHKEKPLFSLPIYYPLAYYTGPDETIDPMSEGRQRQVVGLIRTLFLKRFESSAHAFMQSCQTLVVKLLAWVETHSQTPAEKRRFERWKAQNRDVLEFVQRIRRQLLGDLPEDEAEEDLISEEMLEEVEELDPDEYDVHEMLAETFLDLDELARFLGEMQDLDPSHDDKLQSLVKLLKTAPVLSERKVLVFTEFMATARYLERELKAAGIEGVDEVDSGDSRQRGQVIEQFAPYYNGSSSPELKARGLRESRILISTDVLSEGLNLQDATRLINYDLHWNPVRLMQRIGRVDRRMNPEIEDAILADHPERGPLRGKIAYWNFLPPDEIEELLKIYRRVSHKTLRISKMFGIEGEKLLTPDDEYDALKNFNHKYEGVKSVLESMHLEFEKLFEQTPGLEDRIRNLPGRVFSGKKHPSPGARAVFFCYALPGQAKPEDDEREWTEDSGITRWYVYDLPAEKIQEEPGAIIELIRCQPDTPRRTTEEQETLTQIRKKIEKHIKNGYFKAAQAPATVKPILKCWMELNP